MGSSTFGILGPSRSPELRITPRANQFAEAFAMMHKTMAHTWATVTGITLLLVVRAAAADPDWKVGLGQVKITPERPVPMAGYASRDKLSEKVVADLYVKAMVLEDR